MKGIKAIAVFAICLWAVVVSTYAASVQGDYLLHKTYKMQEMLSSSCSSSTSSGGAE
jgi:hypothetical protein